MIPPSVRARGASLTLGALLGALTLGTAPSAQQFPQLAGNPLTTAADWTEGMECADVENDGDLDLFVADGGGFSSPGTQYQNKLLLNNGSGSFTDASVARLGVNVSHAKGVFTGDVDADGLIDALFTNAFNTDPPHLYINDNGGAGFFLMDSAARGFTNIYSSGGGQFGDVDNDGDLDCIITDSGNSYLGAPGDKPHLFLNDGNGFFSEVTGPSFNPPTKVAQMDAQFFDFDGDWDLDFFGDCRASNTGGNHYLMLNDGSGSFTNASSMLPGTSGNAYEAEVSDVDNDSDVDIFFVSFSGFSEGWAVNDFAPSGPLSFSSGGSVAGTTQDDNEIAMLDYDLDGDLDAVTGSLGSTEKIAVNSFIPSGTLSFTNDNALIQSISDSTLDCTVADVTGDGAYDVLTGQGESNSAQWRNKVYENTGAADNLAPVVVREEALASTFQDGPWIVRAEVRDQVMDDSRNWVTARADYVITTGALAVTSVAVDDGGFLPASITVAPGTRVEWFNGSGAARRISSLTDGHAFGSELAAGTSFAKTFIAPGVYHVEDAGTGEISEIVVAGTTDSVDGFYQSGGMYRFAMVDTAGGAGTHLDYELRFEDWNGNVTTTTPASVPLTPFCGLLKYGELLGGVNILRLNGNGPTGLGDTVDLEFFPVTIDPGLVTLSLNSFNLPILGGTLLINPAQVVFTLQGNKVGTLVTIPFFIPPDVTLEFVDVYFQAYAIDLAFPPEFITMSNGLKVTFCP